jgi:uncharacterized membrane protein YfcA
MVDWFSFLPSPGAMICMFVIVSLAAIVQASLGMGYGLTAAPLLALVDPVFVPVATLIIGMVSSTIGAVGERSRILWRDVLLAVAGRLAGAAIAVLIISLVADKNGFSILFGAAVGVAVLLSAYGHSLKKTTHSLIAMGSVSGVMGTITGVGAPPLALVYQGSDAVQARATLAAIFAFGCASSLLMLMTIGWVGIADLAIAASMLPPMLLGTAVGQKIRAEFEQRYRKALLTLSGVAAVILLVKGFTGNA